MQDMEKNPKISIIIPVYNVEEYLRAAVDSAVNQTYENKEVILVDDGSTDKSGEICDEYAAIYPCIKVIHQPNGGLSAARNSGIKNSIGEYIAFLDSDDEYGVIDMIEKYMSILKNDNTIEILQFPALWYVNSFAKPLYYNIDKCLIGFDQIKESFKSGEISYTAWNKIYRRDVFSVAIFAEGRYFEDNWFLFDIIREIKIWRLCNYGYYLYKIRYGSIMNSKFSIQKCRQRLETHLKQLDFIYKEFPNSPLFLQCYHECISSYFKFSQNYGTNSFSLFEIKLKSYQLPLQTIIKNRNCLHVNYLIKTILTKIIGLRNSYHIYKLKRCCQF